MFWFVWYTYALLTWQVHSDDISNVLILNKKAIANQESQLFKAELEKFRPHQNRILQANHKQSSLLKELTRTYSDLLKDKRVRSEQSKYEAFSRQRNTVMTKYRRINQNFNDLVAGLMRAQNFYSEMKETVTSLQKNVESFVNNRRSEGGQLLAKIEQSKSQGADQEQQRLKELMERMSMDPSGSPVSAGSGGRKKSIPPPLSSTPGYPSMSSSGGIPTYNPAASPPVTPRYPMPPPQQSQPYMSPQQSYAASPFNNAPPRRESYNPNPYPQHAHSSSQSYNPAQHYNPTSPPAHQQFFSPPPPPQQQHHQQQQQHQQQWGQQQQQQQGGWAGAQQGLPQGYVPPPPPPGPPPAQQGQEYGGYGGYGGRMQGNQQQQQPQQQQQNDPWAGLSGWK
jgi:hypothetical protein